MKSFLHQLENNEAILLMYLADELPLQDRQEVEQMLASDENLRRELINLKRIQQKCMDGLAKLDEVSRPAIPEGLAVRQMSRMLRRWHVERTLQPLVKTPARANLRWRTFGGVAAALLLAGGFAWWVNHTDLYTSTRFTVGSTVPAADSTPQADPSIDAPRELTRDEKLALLNGAIAVDDTARSDQRYKQVDSQLETLAAGQDLLNNVPDRGDLER